MGVDASRLFDKYADRGSLRSTSPRVVPGAPFAVASPGLRRTREVGAPTSDLPAIEKRRRYMAALGRIVNRIRQT